MYPVLWVWQVRTSGLQLSHAPVPLEARFQNREQFPKVSTLQVTGASVDGSPLTNMNLKPRWGPVAPTQVLSMRGYTASATLLSLCPSSHRGLRHNGRAQPRGPCYLICWLWLWGVGVGGAPGCSRVLLACWSSLTSRPPQPFHLILTSFTNTDSLGSRSRRREQGPFCGREAEPPHCSSFPRGHPPSHNEILGRNAAQGSQAEAPVGEVRGL